MAKATTKKAVKKAEVKEESEGRVRHWLDNAFIKKVVDGRAEEKSLADIAEELGVARGQVALAELRGRIPVKQRQELEDDPETLTSETVRMRDKEAASWGIISATLGVPESLVRSTYKEATGKDHKGSRIGKGGRHPQGESAPAKTKAEKAPKKATAADPGKIIPMVDMDLAQLKARLEGKTIVVGRSAGKTQKYGVKTVKSLKGGEMEFSDQKSGAMHTIKVQDITKASR